MLSRRKSLALLVAGLLAGAGALVAVLPNPRMHRASGQSVKLADTGGRKVG